MYANLRNELKQYYLEDLPGKVKEYHEDVLPKWIKTIKRVCPYFR